MKNQAPRGLPSTVQLWGPVRPEVCAGIGEVLWPRPAREAFPGPPGQLALHTLLGCVR